MHSNGKLKLHKYHRYLIFRLDVEMYEFIKPQQSTDHVYP